MNFKLPLVVVLALWSAPVLADTTLARDVVHNLGAARLQGPLDPSTQMTIGVFIANPNQAAMDAYLSSLNDPASPNYQQFLEPDEFQSQFGVPQSNSAAVASWLGGAGLTVTSVEGATNYLLASGTAG